MSTKRVDVVGDRCGTVRYDVDGFGAQYDADEGYGTSFAEMSGFAGYDILEFSYENGRYEDLSFRGRVPVCTRRDKTLTIQGKFTYYPPSWSRDTGYKTRLKKSINVDYHPVTADVLSTPTYLRVTVRKDGKRWPNVTVLVDGVNVVTGPSGTADIPRAPGGIVEVVVDDGNGEPYLTMTAAG